MRAHPLAVVIVALAAAAVAAVIALDTERSPVFPPAAPPGSRATIPGTPGALSTRLEASDLALRRAIAGWRSDGGSVSGAPPREVSMWAHYVQRAMHVLSHRRRLADATIRRLPPRLASETRQLTAALRDLRRLSAAAARLSAGRQAHRLRIGEPDPIARMMGFYRAAQRRFGVRWQVLAAVNFVESAFGRVRSESVAGARGPMQFMPSTWRAYGLGGAVRDPHDAILGAANLLHAAGAPQSYARALYAYNPSPLYVDAVRRYSRLMAHDRDIVYLLYSWRP